MSKPATSLVTKTMSENFATSSVTLRIYDLSQGMARQLSPAILGKQIDGIWHTGVQVFDREYYFGGGICSDPPGMTPYGIPHSVHTMGQTQKTRQQFLHFLSQISPSFSLQSYHLLDNNCNNFTDAVCMFLLDKHIPQYILDLPSEALNSPLGPIIRPIIDQMQAAITQQSIGHQVDLPTLALPSSANSPSQAPSQHTSNLDVYWRNPVTLTKANRQAIQTKLHRQSPHTFASDTTPKCDTLIQYALTTSELQHAFPALDYLRLLALDTSDAETIATKITQISQRFILSDHPPAVPRVMALRIFVNLFKHHHTTKVLCKQPVAEILVDSACTSLEMDHPQVRKTAALLLFNFSGASRRHPDATSLTEEHVVRISYATVARLNDDNPPKPEEAAPLMQTVALLADASPDTKMLLSAFELDLDRYQSSDCCPDKDTREAAQRVAKFLS